MWIQPVQLTCILKVFSFHNMRPVDRNVNMELLALTSVLKRAAWLNVKTTTSLKIPRKVTAFQAKALSNCQAQVQVPNPVPTVPKS